MVAVTYRATCGLIAVLGATACTSTLVGRGSSVSGPRTAQSTASVGSSGSRAVPGSSAPAPPSTSCTAATCRQVASASLTNDYVVVLWAGKSSAVDPTSVVELTRGGASVFSSAVPGEDPSGLTCLSSVHASCVVVSRKGGTCARLIFGSWPPGHCGQLVTSTRTQRVLSPSTSTTIVFLTSPYCKPTGQTKPIGKHSFLPASA